jgi:hypothetical protein
MRDAAVYVVVLFMPLAAAASISPRWAHVLRRYIELLVVVIGSKFVIVSVVALAASLISERGADVEHILAATGLLLVACFCPFLLFRMVLSTEAAVAAAFSRRSSVGGAMGMVQMAGGPQGFAHMARSNWSGPEVWSVKEDGGGGGKAGGGQGGPGADGSPGFAAGTGGAGEAAEGAAGRATGGAAATATPLGPVVAGAEVAAQGARSAADHLSHTATAQIAQGQEAPPQPDAGDGASEVPGLREEVPEPFRDEGEMGPDPVEPPPRPPREPETTEGPGSDG